MNVALACTISGCVLFKQFRPRHAFFRGCARAICYRIHAERACDILLQMTSSSTRLDSTGPGTSSSITTGTSNGLANMFRLQILSALKPATKNPSMRGDGCADPFAWTSAKRQVNYLTCTVRELDFVKLERTLTPHPPHGGVRSTPHQCPLLGRRALLYGKCVLTCASPMTHTDAL